MDDLYDISKYTDQQLYDILDINNPTDRELEARIVHLINKYSNMQKETGYKLAAFFQKIYDHFFEVENEIIEEFDNPLQTKDYVDQSGNVQKEPAINENTKYKTTEQELQSTVSFDYVKDKFGLNPLLKQTIKRIICIDSQYRDNKNTTLSTDFNFYLNEPLRDVVSLKLESIQIPLTWWTINKSYGSNFFYLKGLKDGINNGLHDYKFEISPGYYTLGATSIANNQKNIYQAINESIASVSIINSDVSFGNTSVVQDSGTTKIIIDIQKVYNESNYVFDFITDYYTNSIANFLGFMNSTMYEPYAIYSNYNTELTNNIIINNNKYPFQVDSSNNYFTILQYDGPENYTENSSIINTFKVYISTGTYYRDELINEINKQLKNSNFLDSDYCNIERKDIINTSNIYNGYSYYKMKIKLNRFIVQQIVNSKIIIIFPDESNLDRNPTWTKQINRTSALFFDSLYNETNTIYGETTSVFSSIQINPGTSIFLKCKNPPNYVSNTNTINPITHTNLNDYQIPIPAGNYSSVDFINVLNQTFRTYNFDNHVNFTASSIESKLKLNIDIIKDFNNRDWKISFDKSSVLYKFLNIQEVENVTLSNNNIFSGSFQNKTLINQTFVIDTSYILTFSPSSANNGNQNDKSYSIYIPDFRISKSYPNYILLLNGIETAMKQFSISNSPINENQYPLSNSFITSNKRTDNNNIQFIDVTLNVNIEYFLSENNYEIYFNDTTTRNNIKLSQNSWYNVNIDYSYNLYTKKLPIDPNADSRNYSTIISNSAIILNSININSRNNQLKIMMDPSSNVYTPNNNFIITIPEKSYTKYELISYINSVFSSDPRTYGSNFSVYVKNNFEYVKLIMNINIIYTSKDYKLVFYDPYSFIKCFAGSKSVKNTTWDSTLGWILGFRDYTEYELLELNQTFGTEKTYYLDSVQSKYTYQNIYKTDISYGIVKTNVELSGDTNCTLITHTYFYIILDDYIQNHINDGLISITKKETNIELPTYSSKSTIKTCDPVTNTPILSSTVNTDGLTSKQIYALNQSLISKRNAIKSISNNTSISDIFAMIPLKTGGIPNGSYYIETGGNLQNQERNYFGPVNIQRMSIKLVSHNGDVIDLNNTDWSFTFICEQLYRT
jgi:hypothetical protein